MKAAVISGLYYKDHLGGAELQAFFLSKLLASYGATVILVAFGNTNKQEDIEIQEATHFRIARINRACSRAKKRALLNEILVQEAPDVCYLRAFPEIRNVVPVCKALRIPLIVHISSDMMCKPFPRFACFRKYTPSNILNHLLSFYMMSRNADSIICQNQNQLSSLKRYTSDPQKRMVVIKNIWPKFRPPAYPKQKSVVWCANLKPVKQPEIFVEVARRLSHLNYKFIMIGSIQDPRNVKLLKKADSLPNFEYKGFLPLGKTNRLIATSSLFVNTSAQEGFPNTFLQAFSAGVPVVSLNANPDGIFEEYRIGRCSGTLEQLIRDIEFLLTHDEVRKEMGANAKKYFEQQHEWGKVAPLYYDFFARMELRK